MDSGLDRITGMARGYAVSQLLLTAVRLEVFGELRGGALSGRELRRRLGLHPRGAAAFLDALVAHGLLERTGEMYSNSPAAALHLDPAEAGTYLGARLSLESKLYWLWPSLGDSLRTGRPCAAMPEEGGGEAAEPTEWSADYIGAMEPLARTAGRSIARALDWTRYDSFTDVGGANGTLAFELVRERPRLRGTCFDLPQLRGAFEEAAAGRPWASVDFAAGDFFTDPIPEADVAVLGRILHNWAAPDRVKLLGHVHSALRPGGAVVLFDLLIDEHRRTGDRALMSALDQLLFAEGGGEYTFGELSGWLGAAGFRDPVAQPLGDGPESLVVAFRSG
ncbi:methyltransferase [Nocardiopsis potens]|uniref:methyltransferase n=1 Tax=Nocardiopsis potens TaxID=1246458 RepID=UPI00034B20E7|nr:methyltransferase [Nocardiopsis potens]